MKGKRKALFPRSAGPSERTWNNDMHGSDGPVSCEVCGKNHPRTTDDSTYIVDVFLNRQMVEDCCGKAIDVLYREFGEVFAKEFLQEFGEDPTNPRFTMFRDALTRAADETKKSCAEAQRSVGDLQKLAELGKKK